MYVKSTRTNRRSDMVRLAEDYATTTARERYSQVDGPIERLNGEANASLADAKIKARLIELGGTAFPGASSEFGSAAFR
jgi:hypothetical protein